MAMKKIKPLYGKVVAPVVNLPEVDEMSITETVPRSTVKSNVIPTEMISDPVEENIPKAQIEREVPVITSNPNPFLQTKDIFAKAQLTKIGYRMRSEYVEILDIIKKIKKSGYTLEAVLDDALTYYFENSDDGREALRKAKIFYS